MPPSTRPVNAPVAIALKTAARQGERCRILIGQGLLNRAADALLRPGQRVLVVTDHGVPASMHALLVDGLLRLDAHVASITIKPTERAKSLRTLELILDAACEHRLERGDLIIALGGGIITDVAGFAAATYRRGVRVVQCPSTLLAMVDASVGGKTGVNLTTSGGALLKNMAGAFHQPARVVIDTALLESLSDRQLRSGLAECLKHALISGGLGDKLLWTWTQASLHALLAHDPRALAALIARNVRVKARVVAGDERELAPPRKGGRMLLNLGHTFAHAIETVPGLSWPGPPAPGLASPVRAPAPKLVRGPLTHGEAVGLGLLAAARLSRAMRLCEPALPDQVRDALTRAGLPTALHGLPDASEILDRMRHDKKAAAGKLRLILPVRACRAVVREDVPENLVLAAIDAWRA